MNPGSSGWLKVLRGLEKVGSEVLRQSASDAGKIAAGASTHAIDLYTKAWGTTVGGQRDNTMSADMPSMDSQPSEPMRNLENEKDQTKTLPNMLIHAQEKQHSQSSPKENMPIEARSQKTNLTTASEQQSRLETGTAVPSTRIGRAWGFAQLGLNLALGSVAQGANRVLSGSEQGMVVNDRNADTLAASLCRMRGAALKLGQMLSIQDQTLLPPPLTRALAQVRQGADSMPAYQLRNQLQSQLGDVWRDQFIDFDERPFAAASIGQCHRATVRRNGEDHPVVVKVQYPGVAQSIESDLRNLGMLVKFSGVAPNGLFLDNILRVGSEELKVECDYQREASSQKRFCDLVATDPILQENNIHVPIVYQSTDQVLITEYCPGGTIDTVSNLSQDERDRIGRAILYLTMQELFVWRFMQTDPNWGNFLYDHGTQRTSLIDFGACREYSKEFVDGYLRIVCANANRDKDTLLELSHEMNFLTGEENAKMIHAHTQSGFTVGEPFFESSEPFDFKGSQISSRMSEHTSVFLQHRLTAPPTEVYTLHRKLAGAYMLCIQLGSKVRARELLEDIVQNHTFEDGLPRPTL